MTQTVFPFTRRPRVTAFSAGLITAVLASPAVSSLKAAIIHSGMRNITVAADSAVFPSSQSIDLDGRGLSELTLSSNRVSYYQPPYSYPSHLGIGDGMIHVPGGWRTLVSSSMTLLPSAVFARLTGPGSASGTSILGTDVLIGSGSVFLTGDTFSFSSSGPGSQSYFGFRFNPSGDQALYGWGRVTVTPSYAGSPAGNLTLVEWAYEDTGAPIRSGQIPEPGAAALLALAGLAGAGRRRRR